MVDHSVYIRKTKEIVKLIKKYINIDVNRKGGSEGCHVTSFLNSDMFIRILSDNIVEYALNAPSSKGAIQQLSSKPHIMDAVIENSDITLRLIEKMKNSDDKLYYSKLLHDFFKSLQSYIKKLKRDHKMMYDVGDGSHNFGMGLNGYYSPSGSLGGIGRGYLQPSFF